jgi:hypothetical protein
MSLKNFPGVHLGQGLEHTLQPMEAVALLTGAQTRALKEM